MFEKMYVACERASSCINVHATRFHFELYKKFSYVLWPIKKSFFHTCVTTKVTSHLSSSSSSITCLQNENISKDNLPVKFSSNVEREVQLRVKLNVIQRIKRKLKIPEHLNEGFLSDERIVAPILALVAVGRRFKEFVGALVTRQGSCDS